jgi:DNA modification methylase
MIADWINRVHFGDCLETLRRMPDGIVNTCVTSPPYFGLRDYGHPGQIGLEETPEHFIAKLVDVFREVRRVLRDDGTCWVNMGDSYASTTKGSGGTGKSTLGAASGGNGISEAGILRSQERQAMDVRRFDIAAAGLKSKDLIGVPWMLAFALRADGWYLRQDIIWAKPNPMPESITDRCTKAHEYIFLLSKSPRYFCDMDAIKERAVDPIPGNVQQQRVPGEREGENANRRAGATGCMLTLIDSAANATPSSGRVASELWRSPARLSVHIGLTAKMTHGPRTCATGVASGPSARSPIAARTSPPSPRT